MKRFLYIIFAAGLLLISTISYSQTYSYHDSWASQGFNLISSQTAEIEIVFSIEEFSISREYINGDSLDVIQLPSVFLPGETGNPNLPGTGRFIAVPGNSIVSYQIMESRTEMFHGLDISPSPKIPLETEKTIEYPVNKAIYMADAMYPSSVVSISSSHNIRGVEMVMLGITPFQYNPVSKDLIVYRDIRIRISISGGKGSVGDMRLRSRWWDPLIKDMILNPGDIQPKTPEFQDPGL